MWWFIVLLHLPIASPLSCILEQFVALCPWDEMIMQHISVPILSYPSVRALGLGVDVFADMLVCSSHKLEASDPMVTDASDVYTWAATPCLGLAATPLVAGVHHLPAGLPMACI